MFDVERKGVEDTAVDDDFEIALEEAAAEDNRPNKKQKIGKNTKRSYKVGLNLLQINRPLKFWIFVSDL